MENLVDLLESFNRKERYFLIRQALDGFQLGDNFRKVLACKLEIEIPDCAFVAMDYHLDWISTAVHLTRAENSDRYKNLNSEQVAVVEATQLDIDFIVAFEQYGTNHIVLIEAKADGSWDNAQMGKKAKRLAEIFGQDGKKFAENNPPVVPHFLLISPRRPRCLNTEYWAEWMWNPGCEGEERYRWMPLAGYTDRRRPERCDENCRPDENGEYFQIV